MQAHKLQLYERQIEERVFKRKLLQQSLDQGADGGKNDVKLKKSMAAERSRIRELLAVRGSWEAYPNSATSSLGDDIVNQVCNGEFPWTSAGLSGSLAVSDHYARRYRTAKAHVDRGTEEISSLQLETIRAANWVEVRTAALETQLAVLRSGEATPRAAGRTALLMRERALLHQLGSDIACLRQRQQH